MPPYHANAADYLQHADEQRRRTLLSTVGDLQRRLQQAPDARVRVTLRGGGSLEGAALPRDRDMHDNQIVLADVRDGIVASDHILLDDIVSIALVEPEPISFYVAPGAELRTAREELALAAIEIHGAHSFDVPARFGGRSDRLDFDAMTAARRAELTSYVLDRLSIDLDEAPLAIVHQLRDELREELARIAPRVIERLRGDAGLAPIVATREPCGRPTMLADLDQDDRDVVARMQVLNDMLEQTPRFAPREDYRWAAQREIRDRSKARSRIVRQEGTASAAMLSHD